MTTIGSSEERFARIFRSNRTPMAIVAHDGRHLEVNESWLKTFGYRREQVIGRTPAEFGLSFSEPEQIFGALREIAERGSVEDVEADVRTAAGIERTGLLSVQLLQGEASALVTFVDITERRLAEQKARKAHELYEGLVDSIDGIVWEADAETFQFTFVSARAEQMLGYPVRQWLEDPDFWQHHILREDRERTLALCREATRQCRDHEFECRMVAADGKVVWLHDIVTVVAESGRPTRLRGVMVDITSAKQMEREREGLLVREREARQEAEAARNRLAVVVRATDLLGSSLEYGTTLSNVVSLALPDLADGAALFLFGDGGEIDLVEFALKDPGIAEEARGWASRHVVQPDTAHPAAVVRRTGEPYFAPVVEAPEHQWTSGNPSGLVDFLRRMEVRSALAAPLRARGRVIGALLWVRMSASARRYGPDDLAVAVELAQRAALAVDNARLYAAAREANRLKDEFLATLSHELRTPLNAIVGWAQLLREDVLDEHDRASALESIERNAELQTRLVSDLLDVSRIITGKLTLEIRRVELPPIVHAALATVRPAADAKGITLETTVDYPVSPVDGDADRLQQVVWNLLSNAIKFTPREGRVRVGLRQSACSVELRVHDSGEGIAAEFVPFIFERFRQADSSSTRAQGGLGLGLALVRHLVELHGGEVHAASEGPGCGSTFVVTLPAASAESGRAEAVGR